MPAVHVSQQRGVRESFADREEVGKAARKLLPLEQLSQWSPPADRPDPVDLLLGQETNRVQDLLPLRHQRMAVNAFAFYRGSAVVMAWDLGAVGPRSDIDTQLCGDAHLSNFGLFAAPDRNTVFDVNDFDETHPGPWEWDLKRLAASVVLAGRGVKASRSQCQEAAQAAARSYRTSMAAYKPMNELDIFYDRTSADALVKAAKEAGKKNSKAIDDAGKEALESNRWTAVEDLTQLGADGQRQFKSNPPTLTRIPMSTVGDDYVRALYQRYLGTLEDDRRHLLSRYHVMDLANKVVGVGSVGMLAFVVLLQGKNDDDLLILQIKQAQKSVLDPYVATHLRFREQGHRVVTGQRLMQAAGDSFLGWVSADQSHHFYVRQFRDQKWSADPLTFTAPSLSAYGELCGHCLARAHARSGQSVQIASYFGKSEAADAAFAEFGVRYADQAERDYRTFMDAIASGRITAAADPKGKSSLKAVNRVAAASVSAS
jgi:uncharacterized protein (DUF2252 family)